jgi:hypothetical protein
MNSIQRLPDKRSQYFFDCFLSASPLKEPFTLSLSKRRARLRQAQPERVF